MSVAIVFSLLRERSISSDDVFSFSLLSPSLSDPINVLPYLVGELVRVPLVDRLGGEEEGVFVSHLLFLIKLEKGAGERREQDFESSARKKKPKRANAAVATAKDSPAGSLHSSSSRGR